MGNFEAKCLILGRRDKHELASVHFRSMRILYIYIDRIHTGSIESFAAVSANVPRVVPTTLVPIKTTHFFIPSQSSLVFYLPQEPPEADTHPV